jgi:hypothetical protein
MPLADFLKQFGRATPPALANPPNALTPPAAVSPGPACTFNDPEALVTEIKVVEARHTDTSEVQKRRRRRDADAKAREVRERTHVTVRVHTASDDNTEVPTAPHQVCSPARQQQASPAAPAATHTVQDAKPAQPSTSDLAAAALGSTEPPGGVLLEVEHVSGCPTLPPGSAIQATPPRVMLGTRVASSAAAEEGPSAAIRAAQEEKGQTAPATAVQPRIVLTAFTAPEDLLPEVVRARMDMCVARSPAGIVESSRSDVSDEPDRAEEQASWMMEGQVRVEAQDRPVAREGGDCPVGTASQEERGVEAGRDSTPLVESRSSASSQTSSAVGQDPTQDEITPDLGVGRAEHRVEVAQSSSAAAGGARVVPSWVDDADAAPRPAGPRRQPPLAKAGAVFVRLEDIPAQNLSSSPAEDLAHALYMLEQFRLGDLDPATLGATGHWQDEPVEKEIVVDPPGGINTQGGGRGADSITDRPPAGLVRSRTRREQRPRLNEISADVTPAAPPRVPVGGAGCAGHRAEEAEWQQARGPRASTAPDEGRRVETQNRFQVLNVEEGEAPAEMDGLRTGGNTAASDHATLHARNRARTHRRQTASGKRGSRRPLTLADFMPEQGPLLRRRQPRRRGLLLAGAPGIVSERIRAWSTRDLGAEGDFGMCRPRGKRRKPGEGMRGRVTDHIPVLRNKQRQQRFASAADTKPRVGKREAQINTPTSTSTIEGAVRHSRRSVRGSR